MSSTVRASHCNAKDLIDSMLHRRKGDDNYRKRIDYSSEHESSVNVPDDHTWRKKLNVKPPILPNGNHIKSHDAQGNNHRRTGNRKYFQYIQQEKEINIFNDSQFENHCNAKSKLRSNFQQIHSKLHITMEYTDLIINN